MQPRTVSACAPGKLLLLGEYAVVHGRQCLVTAVNPPVVVSASVPAGSFVFNAPDLGFSGDIDFAHEQFPKQVEFAAMAARNFVAGARLRSKFSITTSSLPGMGGKLGLGSSSSVTAGVIAALDRLFGTGLSRDEIFRLCHRTVLDVQKAGSGFDAAAAVFGGTLLYRIGEPQPVKCGNMDLIACHTGVAADTRSLVMEVGSAVAENQPFYSGLFDEIQHLVTMGKSAAESSDWAALGNLFSRNHELLKSFTAPSREYGVSSPAIEKLIAAALDAGAYGAKLSGAGVGDSIIALAPKGRKQDVLDALESAGGLVHNLTANFAGVGANDG